MPSIQDLRELRAQRAKDAKKILDDHPAGKWSDDATAKFDALEKEISDLDTQISRHSRLMDLEADKKVEDKIAEANERSAHVLRNLPADDPRRLYDAWMRGGDKAITAAQWATIRNTMSTTTGSEGGYTVPSLISSQLIDIMKAYGTMRYLAEVIRTADGKPLSYPSSDGTAEVGEIVAQNAAAASQDPTFGTVTLNVFKYSSKVVALPYELAQDSTIDVIAYVNKRLGQRLGRITHQHYTTGAGTTQPDGFVARASAGKVGTTGQTTTIIYDDLVDLVHSVDPAYRGANSAFQTSDTMLRVLRKLKDSAGRPLWSPSYDAGIRLGANNVSEGAAGHGGFSAQNTPTIFDYLLGYPVYVNNDMAVPAANAKSLTFGDHSYYKIRDAMDVMMLRFDDSAYAKLGQIGFLAWMRTGGNLVDTNAVKYYQHSAT